MGFSAMITQLTTTPPTGVIALSISAVVVPGARFLAITKYGPARPRMDIPTADFEFPTMLNWLLRAGEDAVLFNAFRNRSPWVVRPARGLRGGFGGRFLVEDGLFTECKSCVHSELTLPAGRGDALAVDAVRLQDVRYVVLPLTLLSYSYLLDADSASKRAADSWLAIRDSCAWGACSTVLAEDLLGEVLCLAALTTYIRFSSRTSSVRR